MRRTRLVAAAFAGSMWLAALAPAAVAAEPVAEVSPHRVRPGGTVTVTVTCPKHDEQVGYITAFSQAFEKGEAKLKLLPRGGRYGKATYSGTARIASAPHFTGSWGSESYGSGDSYDSEESYESEEFHGSEESYGSFSESSSSDGSADSWSGPDEDFGAEGSYDTEGSTEDSSSWEGSSGSGGSYGSGDSSDGGFSRHGKRYGVNGSCPDGSDFTASVVVERKPHGGAHAGVGGSQGGGVDIAAVAAGGALLCVTVGFGVHALRRRSEV